MSIFPYIYYMVKDFNITEDESRISFYTGMVTSAFTFAEFSTSVMWGKLSDRIGRKPVLLTGLAGTGLSVLMFGFAANLPVALFARALGGLLNGYVPYQGMPNRRASLTLHPRNIGVIQTTVAELITVKEHQSKLRDTRHLWHRSIADHATQHARIRSCRLFGALGKSHVIDRASWTETDWSRSIIGPMIGGALAKPVDAFPSIFQRGSIWDRYPYLLPNLFSAICVFCGVIIGILFLEETHSEQKHRRDRGLELGNYLLSCIPWTSSSSSQPKSAEEESLLEAEEQLPGYRTTENSPRLVSRRGCADLVEPLDLESTERRTTVTLERRMVTKTFTRPVVLNIVSYGILAL